MRKTGGIFEIDTKRANLSALESDVQKPDFWQSENASKKIKEYTDLKNHIESWQKLKDSLQQSEELFHLSVAENDQEILGQHDFGDFPEIVRFVLFKPEQLGCRETGKGDVGRVL